MIYISKSIKPSLYALILILVSAGIAGALTIKGIDFANETTIGQKKIYLNGVGVRKTFFNSFYACALYLPHPTSSGEKAIKVDSGKEIVLHVLMSKLSKDEIIKDWNDGFFNNSQEKLYILQDRVTTFNTFFTRDLVANDRISFRYIPGLGTTIKINDDTKGTIPGSDFMQALWAIWLGTNPVDSNMKYGMLDK